MTSRSMPTDALPADRRHALSQRTDVVGVEVHGFLVAGVAGGDLGLEALGLVFRVVASRASGRVTCIELKTKRETDLTGGRSGLPLNDAGCMRRTQQFR